MKKNITYTSSAIEEFYRSNRIQWTHFYESERRIIEKIGINENFRILDVGCGCGGLGLALRERFGVNEYTGVEINYQSVLTAKKMNPQAFIIQGDILEVDSSIIGKANFDVVFSLSCVDWNIQFNQMLSALWAYVIPGGHLISTFRLTTDTGCEELAKSYQYINFDGKKNGECAPYIVKNVSDLLHQIIVLSPSDIHAYGYWGVPSASASTPYDRLCFAAFAIRKHDKGESGIPKMSLDLPQEILSSINLKD